MKVNVLGDDISNLELIDSMPEGFDNPILYASVDAKSITKTEKRILDAARISFDKGFDDSIQTEEQWQRDVNLLNYLVKNMHTSPFEHVIFTFLVKCPLFVARQWMRHRTWSFNELSRRYTHANIEFYIPQLWNGQSKKNKQVGDAEIDIEVQDDFSASLLEMNEVALDLYHQAIDAGISNEQARMFLPQNAYTSFVGTIDLHNLMKFVILRNSPHAQFETRLYAEYLDKLLQQAIPNCYDAYKHYWSTKDE